MADRFLTISEAEKFTGKSRSTLRRYIDGIVKAEKSPDRHLLTPTPDEARTFREQNQPFAWKISEELLRRQFLKPDESSTPDPEKGTGGTPGSDSLRLVVVLEKTVAMLENELKEKNNQINAMNERLREGNILMADLQKRLTLPAGKGSDVPTQAESRPDATVRTDTKNAEAASSSKFPFAWLFRK
jgi:hypothetical protein